MTIQEMADAYRLQCDRQDAVRKAEQDVLVDVKITKVRLLAVAKMADWQLRQIGFCPKSITEAVLKLES